MERKRAERSHVGAFVVHVLESVDGAFCVDRFNTASLQQSPLWTETRSSTEGAKRYADERLKREGHDCDQLGCSPWVDFS